MTIESQLERICVALEALARMHAPLVTTSIDVPKVEVKTKKTEPKIVCSVSDEIAMHNIEKAHAEGKLPQSNEDIASFDDLADKVKALGRMNRDAVVALFKQFGIERLGGLEEKDYIAFDIAIAKALNKANEA